MSDSVIQDDQNDITMDKEKIQKVFLCFSCFTNEIAFTDCKLL